MALWSDAAPTMNTNPNPDPAPEPLWKIEGKITPAPIGLSYKLGALLNAVAMLLISGLYLGLIGGLAWMIYWQWFVDHASAGRTKWNQDQELGGFILTVAGAFILLFLLKPLFAR